MLFLNNKFNTGKSSMFINPKAFKGIEIGIVTKVGKLDNASSERDKKFNADEHIIRCDVPGNNNATRNINCQPLLPKHLNIVPIEKEAVLIFTFSSENKEDDVYYIGPIISSPDRLNYDAGYGSGLANFSFGTTTESKDISANPNAVGIYENPSNVVIDGRQNTDLVQRDNEVLIRAGKFVYNEPTQFNKTNPAYIQIKHNQSVTNPETGRQEKISVNNIVANKINLLTYKDGSPEFGDLTYVNKDTGVAEYINEDELNRILETAHPLVFGDLLVEYLRLFKKALVNHVHNGNGNKPTDRTDGGGTLPLDDFIKKAEALEKRMLSKNIRIN